MNKNKIIFGIIGVILLIVLVYTIISINKKSSTGNNKAGKFNIWIIGDKVDSTEKLIANFKKLNTKYSNVDIKIEAFKNFDDYSYALTSSIFSGKSPDIFMLNNNEKDSIFSKQAIGISPESVNPSDFRKKYKGIFADDLISSTGSVEYLMGLPVGYETLGIFYNRRYVKDSELSSIAGLNNIVADLKDKYPDIIPIGIGNGSTVYGVADIITQFFMLDEGVLGLTDLVGKKSIQGLSSYFVYGDEGGYNGYDSKYIELNNLGQTGVDLFSKGETFMVVGYPSLINQIAEKGFSKNFLLASPFPHYSTNEGKTLVNYNYFVINKSSKEQNLANDFLAYLSTDVGAEDYLSYFPYYLPALLSLESDKLDQKINPNYNIVLSDFYNPDYELSSFNKGIKTLYDKGIISILDNASNYDKSFLKFRESILCKAQKIITLENLSVVCE